MGDALSAVVAPVIIALQTDANAAEVVFIAVALPLVWLAPHLAIRPWRFLDGGLRRICRRKKLAVLVVGMLAILVRLACLPLLPAPVPVITDEFSHLLLADTLRRGRLTNPTHPMWPHFETIHVFHQPTYNSMYLPGQALFLATGQLVFGHPWAGVLLSTGLMAAAACWMLQAWVGPKWALLGGLIVVFRYGVFSYWGNSYWGGAVPAMAGALVLGALPRLKQNARPAAALWLGVGLVLLANTRPFEGLVFTVPVAVYLFRWLWKEGRSRSNRVALRSAGVLVVVLAAGAAFTLYYCWRVTGSPFKLPYQVNQETYGWPMTLAIFDPPKISHPIPQLRQYYEWELGEHDKLVHVRERIVDHVLDAVRLWSFYLGPALTVFALVGFRRAWRGRAAFLTTVVCLTAAAASIEQTRYPHYVAPATAALLGIVVCGLRVSLLRKRTVSSGVALPVIVLLAGWAALPLRLSGFEAGSYASWNRYLSWCCGAPGNIARAKLDESLRRAGGRHLVVVRYGAGHKWMCEWVYNEADIDRAVVVWARDLGEQPNRRLFRYFADRTIWLLTPEETPVLRPYFSAQPPGSDFGRR